jgi:hypothetical protein
VSRFSILQQTTAYSGIPPLGAARATSETLRQQATQEGLVPLKAWVKSALDHVIQVCMNEAGLEFVWVGDDAVDPLEQTQTLQILVSAGIKTREEARAELGLGAAGRRTKPRAIRSRNGPTIPANRAMNEADGQTKEVLKREAILAME